MSVLGYINEDKYPHQISSELIDSTCYESDMNSYNTEGEVDVTTIDFTSKTTCISKNYDVHVVHNYYSPLLSPNNQKD